MPGVGARGQNLEHLRFFMPPTLKKWGAYWFRLVRSSVRSSVRPVKTEFKLGF